MDGVVAERDAEYRTDEHAWLLRQADLLRHRSLTALDSDNLAEFLEDMAKRDLREVASRLRLLMVHMLKFRVKPERAGRSWAITVVREQNNLANLLDAASLRRLAGDLWTNEWERARREAARETELPLNAFPSSNPWSLDEALIWEPPGGQPTLRPRPKKK
jgi:uncharacterized membrane protein YheB (UPF0754 family)